MKVFCPEDIYYHVKSHDEIMIRWPEPIFKDNVEVVRTESNFKNGQLHKPTSFNVVYDAYDALNNYATCEFQVHIECKSSFLYVVYVKQYNSNVSNRIKKKFHKVKCFLLILPWERKD